MFNNDTDYFMKRNIVKIIILIGIVVIVTLGMVLGFKEYKISKAGLNDYYKKIARRCPFISYISGFNCCFDSVVDMSRHGYKTPSKDGCPEGYENQQALCTGSVSFCVPPKE